MKFLSLRDQLLKMRKEGEAAAARRVESERVGGIVFVTLAESGAIDEVTAAEHTRLFTPWQAGIDYAIGRMVSFDGVLYRCVQAHTSQEDWTPDSAASLWSKIGDPTEEYPNWSRPIGAHDAYAEGDRVTFGEKHWVSELSGNVWEPGVYGWSEVAG